MSVNLQKVTTCLIVLIWHLHLIKQANGESSWQSSGPTNDHMGKERFLANFNCPSTTPENTTRCHLIEHNDKYDTRNVYQRNMWLALSRLNCHEELAHFVCSVYSPICRKSHLTANILPCRELCTSVYHGCSEAMEMFGFVWPEKLDCSVFPQQHESMCLPPASSTDSDIKCYPCENTLTRENVQEKFCNSNIAQLVQYKNFQVSQGIQNIKIVLGPRTKPLKLIKKDGTFTNISSQLNNNIFEKDYHRYRREPSPGFNPPFRQFQQGQRRRRYKRSLSISEYRRMYSDSQNTGRSEERPRMSGRMASQQADKPIRSPNMRQRGNRKMSAIRNRRESRIFNLDDVTDLQLDCSTCSELHNLNSSDRWLIMGERQVTDGHFGNTVKIHHMMKMRPENSFIRPFIRFWRSRASVLACNMKL